MYRDFGTVLVAAILGIIMVAVPLIVQSLVAPSKKSKEKLETYECGEESEGSAWLQFNIRFYVIALIFLIFDVEVVFLFPWAVVFKDLGLLAMVEMAIFLVILIVGLAYVWVKADLNWVKRKVKYAAGRYDQIQLKETN
ncbi:MAG: NADH-quinone oxidoreductase subunit A [Candidatus Marinimicrobia bacterium]|jgi:NADH-quinone oxidoreductase subunit A|uniref:NADH:ubiquinone oxidoreductase subunit 3 (Chain A) n=1 Tax=marine metagenome TaxID=408172 RepID=A0A381YW05_9ZZZZ|nr:NADH-quinone oxidoreductase subunit A [Candidatus Neomarinimicrobiota bacterium]MBT3848560.1 NADH-quinone oxidoreductase subunit A [Candidatus Neomarinimicrobiota bacterium]MBT4055215.1 NADH-quinone oxidoreductase subunit A [Candidatus Neomarinimicrobiota bacterium]MBT4370843.1 NADH-quinone oxidoreductase subunit A [Candidatus Neomarinimicrobiota bacterium]MBT4662636.1 NADH-quinone oxidoreductase subunit A [Candidatus Neomarinimicrobiota bacterium]|tara:strand:- start:218 stop:634 length:417 start_codon:yes stop_codon:yes gene_type:complete